MVIGTTLFKMDGNSYYSPEFPRGGLAATFAADVTNLVGSPTFTISVEHRNADETSFSTLGQFDAITAVGPDNKDLSVIKEIVRFKYDFDATDDATDGVHFLMMAPSWRPY